MLACVGCASVLCCSRGSQSWADLSKYKDWHELQTRCYPKHGGHTQRMVALQASGQDVYIDASLLFSLLSRLSRKSAWKLVGRCVLYIYNQGSSTSVCIIAPPHTSRRDWNPCLTIWAGWRSIRLSSLSTYPQPCPATPCVRENRGDRQQQSCTC